MPEDFAGHISVTHWKILTHKENYYDIYLNYSDIYFFIQSSYIKVLCQGKKTPKCQTENKSTLFYEVGREPF